MNGNPAIDDGIVYMNEPKISSHLNPYQYSVEERRCVPNSRSMPHITPFLQKDGQTMPPKSTITRSSTRVDMPKEDVMQSQDTTKFLVPEKYVDDEEDDDEDTIKDYDEDNFMTKAKTTPRSITTTIL